MVEPVPFVELRLRGRRFDDPGMPVAAMAEIVAYRELLVAAAKEVFRAGNPSRQRMPRGFEDRLDLRQRRVLEGSALNVLERIIPDGALPDVPDEFDQARDLIERAISAAAAVDGAIPADFPESVLPYFDRFGRTLGRDEHIEVSRPGSRTRAAYNLRVRKQILLSRSDVYRSQISLIGRVVALDAEQAIFRLKTLNNDLVPCRLDPSFFTVVRDNLHLGGDGPLIRVDGIAMRDRGEAIKRVDEVYDIAPVDELDDLNPDPTPSRGSAGSRLVTRLREIAALDDGWLDGEGLKVRSAVLAEAIGTIGQLSDDPALAGEVDHVRAFPTMEGGLQFEFSSGDLEGSVELRPDLTAHFSESDLVSGEDDESTFQAGELLDALRRLLGVPA